MSKKKITEETVPHVVSEEDLTANPELAEAGVEVGEEIGLPVPDVANPAAFTVISSSGGEVRTYSTEIHGEDAEALANEFAGKIGGKVT